MESNPDRAGDKDRISGRHCLVPDCGCQDPRIVSPRRAAFFAAWATAHGETADRAIEPDPDWRWIPLTPRTG